MKSLKDLFLIICINIKDNPDYNPKSNSYEYEDVTGYEGIINADAIKIIQPIEAEIPKVEQEKTTPSVELSTEEVETAEPEVPEPTEDNIEQLHLNNKKDRPTPIFFIALENYFNCII